LHSDSLEVNCIPGLDGGSPQHFLLEVKVYSAIGQIDPHITIQNDQGTIEESSLYKEINPTPNFQLHNLKPGNDYTAYIYAINRRGMSEPVLLEHIRVENMDKNFPEDLKKALSQTSSENMIIVIALTGTGKIEITGFLYNNLN